MTLEVWKFGGASLADGRAIQKAARQIATHRGPLVVVASALAGVTDLLLQATPGAARVFRKQHRQVARAVLGPGAALTALNSTIDTLAREYEDLCAAVAVLGRPDARLQDALVSRGERLSARLLVAGVTRLKRRARFIDALDVVATDDEHGGATPKLDETRVRARKTIGAATAAGAVAIIPGYIGRAADGSLTTLGRGGSDLTATLLARSLGARTVVLWKDVPGILTADPRLVPDARLIPQLHHREAAEVAHYGAKVLHPRALIPIASTTIALHVRSFINPEQPGTEVSARQALKAYPVKALAMLPAQAVVTVAGKGMVGVHGIAARTFAAVDAEGLSVSTIFQASSESSIGFTIPESQAERAVRRLRQAFRHELEQGLIDGVSARPHMSVVAVVGEGMVGTPGISARVFAALESGGINVVAIAQGSSERNISFVVSSAQAPEAARRVHAAFQLSKIGGGQPITKRHIDVVLLGFGRVGRALSDQVATAADRDVRIVGLLDRSGYVFDSRGLSRARLLRLARDKDAGALLATLGGHRASAAEALSVLSNHAVSRPVMVDVTSDDTGALLQSAISHGFDVVLANKKPLAGSLDAYDRLITVPAQTGRRVRYEATVGAGLPIIDTFRKLDETGDRVLRIDGCVSGTLMFVLSEVSAGRPFSAAVREAVARGYAEPDPRDDLSGRDAARKGLILARMLGYRGEAPRPDDLVPKAYAALSLETFLERMPELDAAWQARAVALATKGRVLRYVVSATPRTVSAGLMEVPVSSPMGSASGTRNLVTFHSRRYQREPLVISGPGAGADVTAAGILNDIRSLGTA
ncbi:MAG: aspartate kinase [Acidobacteriota bacterium]|nr:aspartate kinase [Acidobacteriota bacterium]